MTAAGNIRLATDADLAAVSEWLREEDARGVDGCFWCNIKVIRECHGEGQMTVLADPRSDQPLAFLTAGLDYPSMSILEVRHDHRGRGLGRALVQHHLNRAIEAGLPGLVIQRRPAASIPFWNHMGFRELPLPDCFWQTFPYNDEHAVRVFDTPLQFDPETDRVLIEARIETVSGDPVRSHLLGARTSWRADFPIQLECRFVVFSPDPDLYVQYLINGDALFPRHKLKYPESQLVTCGPFRSLEQLTEPADN